MAEKPSRDLKTVILSTAKIVFQGLGVLVLIVFVFAVYLTLQKGKISNAHDLVNLKRDQAREIARTITFTVAAEGCLATPTGSWERWLKSREEAVKAISLYEQVPKGPDSLKGPDDSSKKFREEVKEIEEKLLQKRKLCEVNGPND